MNLMEHSSPCSLEGRENPRLIINIRGDQRTSASCIYLKTHLLPTCLKAELGKFSQTGTGLCQQWKGGFGQPLMVGLVWTCCRL